MRINYLFKEIISRGRMQGEMRINCAGGNKDYDAQHSKNQSQHTRKCCEVMNGREYDSDEQRL